MSTYSPAALILMGAGRSLTEVGDRLGMSKQSLSWHFSGNSLELPDGLRPVLEELTDAYTADRIIEAIASARVSA